MFILLAKQIEKKINFLFFFIFISFRIFAIEDIIIINKFNSYFGFNETNIENLTKNILYLNDKLNERSYYIKDDKVISFYDNSKKYEKYNENHIDLDKAFKIAEKIKGKFLKFNNIEKEFILYETIEPYNFYKHKKSYYIKGNYIIFNWKPLYHNIINYDEDLTIKLNIKGDFYGISFSEYNYPIVNKIVLTEEEAKNKIEPFIKRYNFGKRVNEIINVDVYITTPIYNYDKDNNLIQYTYYTEKEEKPDYIQKYHYVYFIEAEIECDFCDTKYNNIIFAVDTETGKIISKLTSKNDNIIKKSSYDNSYYEMEEVFE